MAINNGWVHIGGLGIVAAIAGAMVANTAALAIAPALAVDGSTKDTMRAPQRAEPRDFHEASRYNIFGKPVEDFDFTAIEAPPEEPDDEPEEEEELMISELKLELVGTSVFSDPSTSLASIKDTSSKQTDGIVYSTLDCPPPLDAQIHEDMVSGPDRLARVPADLLQKQAAAEVEPCKDLPHQAQLLEIMVDRAIIMNTQQQRREVLPLGDLEEFKKKKTKKGAKPPIVALQEKKTNPVTEEKSEWQIDKVGENRYEIPRTEVLRAMGEMADLSRMARAVPTADGFNLKWIRKGSVFEKLGLSRGDVIQSVNGYDVKTMDGAMNAFQKLKDGSAFALDIKRGSSNVSLEYNIKD